MKEMQATSNALNLGLNYSAEIGKLNTIGNLFKIGGWAFSGASAYISFWQMKHANTTSGKIGYGMNGVMNILGAFGVPGLIGSSYYFYFAKPFYPLMWESMKNEAIMRANMMQNGYPYMWHGW